MPIANRAVVTLWETAQVKSSTNRLAHRMSSANGSYMHAVCSFLHYPLDLGAAGSLCSQLAEKQEEGRPTDLPKLPQLTPGSLSPSRCVSHELLEDISVECVRWDASCFLFSCSVLVVAICFGF